MEERVACIRKKADPKSDWLDSFHSAAWGSAGRCSRALMPSRCTRCSPLVASAVEAKKRVAPFCNPRKRTRVNLRSRQVTSMTCSTTGVPDFLCRCVCFHWVTVRVCVLTRVFTRLLRTFPLIRCVTFCETVLRQTKHQNRGNPKPPNTKWHTHPRSTHLRWLLGPGAPSNPTSASSC